LAVCREDLSGNVRYPIGSIFAGHLEESACDHRRQSFGGRRLAALLKQTASNPYLQERGILRVRIDANIGLLALLVRSTTALQDLKPFDFADRQGGPRSPAASISDRLLRMRTKRGIEAIHFDSMAVALFAIHTCMLTTESLLPVHRLKTAESKARRIVRIIFSR
jgi:hypothetical protein